jgi:AcrR family transcriptional regulator
LIEGGLEAFGTRGFHLAGVRDVCAAARLTERYFYESFRNREALFLAVYQDAVQRVRDAVTRAVADAPPRPADLARAGLGAALALYRDDPRLARVLLVDVLSIGPEAGDAQSTVSTSFADWIGALVRARYPELVEQGLDPQLVANALYGSTLYLTMRWTAGGYQEPLERVLDHCVLVFDAFFTEMKRRKRARPKPRRVKPRHVKSSKRAFRKEGQR